MAASGDSKAPPLPPKFHTVEDSFGVPEKKFVNIIGIVKDYQPPFQTGGEGMSFGDYLGWKHSC